MKALIDAANAAGGKDNVTAVYVEGEQFATLPRVEPPPSETEITRRLAATRRTGGAAARSAADRASPTSPSLASAAGDPPDVRSI